MCSVKKEPIYLSVETLNRTGERGIISTWRHDEEQIFQTDRSVPAWKLSRSWLQLLAFTILVKFHNDASADQTKTCAFNVSYVHWDWLQINLYCGWKNRLYNIFCDSRTNRSRTELTIDGDCSVWYLSLSLDHFSVDKTGALICSRTDDPKLYGTKRLSVFSLMKSEGINHL